MPAINYYIPEQKYARLIYISMQKNLKVKKLIDEALDKWLEAYVDELDVI